MAAKYIIRFDDICPTMNWRAWEPVEAALLDLGIKPIVGVVPDNQDPALCVSDPEPGFWTRVRDWQTRGWSIGLHGYQHRLKPCSGGLLRINGFGEFVGLSEFEQTLRLEKGLTIFASHNVTPDLWVAPGHSFDRTTLRVLQQAGLNVVSDGFGIFPHRDASGVTWVPQQMWRLRRMPLGVWTVCLHHNLWTPDQTERFIETLHRFRADIVSLPDVLKMYGHRNATAADNGVRLLLSTLLHAKRTFRNLSASSPR